MKKIFLWIGLILLSPILLFIILTIALYLPPVQNWAVDKVVEYASEKTGYGITVDRVDLVFPLDLGINGFCMVQPNDSLPQVNDTVADVRKLVVDVSLMPLLDGKVVINSFELNRVKVNIFHKSSVIHQFGWKPLGLIGYDKGHIPTSSKSICLYMIYRPTDEKD